MTFVSIDSMCGKKKKGSVIRCHSTHSIFVLTFFKYFPTPYEENNIFSCILHVLVYATLIIKMRSSFMRNYFKHEVVSILVPWKQSQEGCRAFAQSCKWRDLRVIMISAMSVSCDHPSFSEASSISLLLTSFHSKVSLLIIVNLSKSLSMGIY